MVNPSLAIFCARLNVAKANRFKSIKVPNIRINLNLLNLFYELGIISGFFIDEENFIEVFLKYKKSNTIFKKIVYFSKPSKKIFVNLLKLYKIKKKI